MINIEGIVKSVNVLIEDHETRDPLKIIEDLRVPITYVDTTLSFPAAYFYDDIEELGYFVINTKSEEYMIKPYLGHELCHYFIHDGFKIYDYENAHTKFESSIKETEANMFAAWLLLDEEEVKDLIYVYNYTESMIAKRYGVPEFYVGYKIDMMMKLGYFDNKVIGY